MIEKTYIEMEYRELDELIKKTYGHEYEFVCYEELGNGVDKSFTVKAEILDGWAQADLDGFIATGKIGRWRTHTLLTDMVNRGILKPGNYLIEVFW